VSKLFLAYSKNKAKEKAYNGRCEYLVPDANPFDKMMGGQIHGGVVLNESFWESLESLVKSTQLIIDRPKSSPHPRYPLMIYPLDYGYLKGTKSGDGNDLDVWRGSLKEAILDAIICTVVLMKKDVEVKLLLGCSEKEKIVIRDFYTDSGYMAAILIERFNH
jgi:inorganic pyrophosphatase